MNWQRPVKVIKLYYSAEDTAAETAADTELVTALISKGVICRV